jgi:hypothetical protein
MIENPTNKEIVMQISLSNPKNFQMNTTGTLYKFDSTFARVERSMYEVMLSPHQKFTTQLVFWPSKMDANTPCTIEMNCRELGKTIYLIQGIGTETSNMETISIMANYGDEVTGAIKFENPFFEPISIMTNLVQSEKSFNWAKNSKQIYLKPLEKVFLPVNYSPQRMTTSKAMIEISLSGQSSEFIWKYNLEGIPIIQSRHNLELRSKARHKHSQKFELLIDHIYWNEGEFRFGVNESNNVIEFKNNFSLEIMDATGQKTFPGFQKLDWSDKLKNVVLDLLKCSNSNGEGLLIELSVLIF